MKWLVFAAAVYLIAPGHPDAPLAGLPLGQTATFLLILLIAAGIWTRDQRAGPFQRRLTHVIAVGIAIKVLIAAIVPQSGWVASYYANDQFAPPARRSIDFLRLNATRIDRQLSFEGATFPVHFFNDHGFNFGAERERTQPFSVHWRGHLHNDAPIAIASDAGGQLTFVIDGATRNDSLIELDPGDHIIDVRYRKLADTDGRLMVSPRDAHGTLRPWRVGEVTALPATTGQRTAAAVLRYLAMLLSAIVLAAAAIGLAAAMSAKAAAAHRLHDWVAPAVLIGLSLQGLWKARAFVGRVVTLTGGDDWLAYEMNARDVLLNGWLMTAGREQTGPFFEYPGYAYFLAAVHAITGESLAGVILMNFVVLALATLVVFALAQTMFSDRAALIATAWLLALEQMDFVRYYTVTLLSENLFVLLAALTVYLLVRFAISGRWTALAAAGVCGGLGSATRPTLLLYLPCAIVLLALIRGRVGDARRVTTVSLILVVSWMVAIAPFTYRNYVVSGTPVLITAGQAETFVRYNLPATDLTAERKYLASFSGGNAAAARTLVQILLDHPRETLRTWGLKIAFALGMVHWAGSSVHPELVLTSVLYVAAVLVVRAARAPVTWLVHAFVLGHMATLLLTQPWTYGYRMLLPMYLLAPIFVGALAAHTLDRWRTPAGSRPVAPEQSEGGAAVMP